MPLARVSWCGTKRPWRADANPFSSASGTYASASAGRYRGGMDFAMSAKAIDYRAVVLHDRNASSALRPITTTIHFARPDRPTTPPPIIRGTENQGRRPRPGLFPVGRESHARAGSPNLEYAAGRNDRMEHGNRARRLNTPAPDTNMEISASCFGTEAATCMGCGCALRPLLIPQPPSR